MCLYLITYAVVIVWLKLLVQTQFWYQDIDKWAPQLNDACCCIPVIFVKLLWVSRFCWFSHVFAAHCVGCSYGDPITMPAYRQMRSSIECGGILLYSSNFHQAPSVSCCFCWVFHGFEAHYVRCSWCVAQAPVQNLIRCQHIDKCALQSKKGACCCIPVIFINLLEFLVVSVDSFICL